MISKRYLVTTTVRGRSKTQVWDTKKSLGIGFPFRWILEPAKSGGIQIRSLKGKGLPSKVYPVDVASIEDGNVIDLSGKLKLRLRTLRTIEPPYVPKATETEEHKPGFEEAPILMIYSGIRNHLTGSRGVRASYIAHRRGGSAFSVSRESNGYHVKFLAEGITLHTEGQLPILAQRGSTVVIKPEDAGHTTIMEGKYWWRFKQVHRPKFAVVASDMALDEDEIFYRRVRRGVSFAMTVLLLVTWIEAMRENPKEDLKKKIEEAPTLKLVQHKTPKFFKAAAARGGVAQSEMADEQHPSDSVSAAKDKAKSAAQAKSTMLAEQAPTQSETKDHAKSKADQLSANMNAKSKSARAHSANDLAVANARNSGSAEAADAAAAKSDAKAHANRASKSDAAEAVARARNQPTQPRSMAKENAASRAAARRNAESAAALAQARALRDMVGGAASNLLQKDLDAKEREAPSGARSNDHSSELAEYSPTKLKPSFSGSAVGVSRAGGGSGARRGPAQGGGAGDDVGYGTGAQDGLAKSGNGSSFVTLDSGGSEVDEGLTKEEVGRVIHKHMEEIRYCHEASLLRSSRNEGKVVLDFKIDPNGSVDKAAINSSSVPDNELPSCIMRRLVTWKFPKPKGRIYVSVSYPFLFKTLGRTAGGTD